MNRYVLFHLYGNFEKESMTLARKILPVWVMAILFSSMGCTEQPALMPTRKHKIIQLQPYEDFSTKEARLLQDSLNMYFKHNTLRAPIKLPQSAYVKARKRYRADTLIRQLRDATINDTITVGLTHSDISVTKNGISDWGVMGLGYKPGRGCVISTFRLKKENKHSQLVKVVLHEIAHTLGLPHCKNQTCLMRDAEGGNPLEQEKEFCSNCKRILMSKGMILKS
jgi:archaemetzincin